ncbi:fumarylacetoacetate hydrolase family protein [Crenobacter sp. SG2303]|uniref:Fumarylacetoacetate hydrolase family protein n=1 Tax=Crenobacter oryzisoli TaxID=3056844 RepID=A0ABT7XUE7_9NEIS|nr:fumarylacetoacetate hydrolase family protein [Crenobacter sp. SG2303]MDN0077411.1 fumarylacetoacetate hydrolase family protein [Crenobacter sp. SG2303]
MKVVHVEHQGRRLVGLIDPQGQIHDASELLTGFTGTPYSDAWFARLGAMPVEVLPMIERPVRYLPCVQGVGKFIGIGLNYRDHALEAGLPLPRQPIVFGKWTSSLSGAYDPIRLPEGSMHTDWEVELGVVIGKAGHNIPQETALEHVAGYCVVNDITERRWQGLDGGQWALSKGADSFGPIGPWLVSRDEIADPNALALWLEVDGIRYQNGHTSQMIFPVAELIAYLSRFMTLKPGDVIATGTPAGVGMGHKPPVYLRPGQHVRLSVEGLGIQEHLVD